MALQEVITVEDGDRDLVFTVDATYVVLDDGEIELVSCLPLRGYVVMPIIDHRERLATGKDQKEEFEFPLPDCAGFRKRFRQDYEDAILDVLSDLVTDRAENASVLAW